MLLGASEIVHGARWGHWKAILGDRPTPAIVDAHTLAQQIADALDPDTASEVRELADGYKLALAELDQRTHQYRDKPIEHLPVRGRAGGARSTADRVGGGRL